MTNLIERFESKIYYSIDNCWYWTGSLCPRGYARISINGKNQRASRISYKIYKGEFNHNLIICHSCDNPSCVNPDHLFIGTHTDNMRDMVNKKRNKPTIGENCHLSKLDNISVTKIRSMIGNIPDKDIAGIFNVSLGAIQGIKHNRTWKQKH